MSSYGGILVLYYWVYYSVAQFLIRYFHLRLLMRCLHPRLGNIFTHLWYWFGFWFCLPLICFILGITLVLCNGILCYNHHHWVRVKSVCQNRHCHLGNHPNYNWWRHCQDNQTYFPQFNLHQMGCIHWHLHLPWIHFNSCQWMLCPLNNFWQGHELCWSYHLSLLMACIDCG